MISIIISLVLLSLATTALAASISPTAKYAWSETAGWVNFTPSGGGVTVYADHLEGLAWIESIGWIKLGSHTVGGSLTYGNTSNADWGVNRSGTALSGFAWSETSGWINFTPTGGGVTMNTSTGAFDGFAWSESLGWLHLKGTATNADSYGVRVILPTLTVTIVGSGTVASQNEGGTSYSCNKTGGGVCDPVTFGYGDSVTLTATPDINTSLTGWSIDNSNGGNANPYTGLLMNGNRAVTATFAANPPMVQISGSTAVYYTLISALADCGGDATILARDIAFTGGLTITAHTIKLSGGFPDVTFTGDRSGYTTINGRVNIQGGLLIADRVKVGP